MKRKTIDQYIYSITKKPAHYVEVRNPPRTAKEKLARPQAARQLQYNRWSKRYQVFSGSYLPCDHKDLRKKGWSKKRISDKDHHFYQRKSTNQTVRFDSERINKKGQKEAGHYHWYIWWKSHFGKRDEQIMRKNQYKNGRKEKVYYNEYGEATSFGNPDHHIYPQK